MTLPRTGVFVDGDWVQVVARQLGRRVNYERITGLLRSHFGTQTAIHVHLSIRDGDTRSLALLKQLTELRCEVRSYPIRNVGGRMIVKGIDVGLAVDAVSLPPEFDRIVLVSGDNDFVPVLEAAKTAGRSTVVIALPVAAGTALMRAAHRFISLEDLLSDPIALLEAPAVLGTPPPKEEIKNQLLIRKGDHVAAYMVFRRILLKAKRELVVFDPYVSDQLPTMFRLLDKAIQITLFTDKVGVPDFCILIKKLRLEGRPVAVFRLKDVHDRFIRTDAEWWMSGHSIKDTGGKYSFISRVTDSTATAELNLMEAEARKGAIPICT